MSKTKIKAPYQCMDLKEYKLFDFVPEFSEFRQFDDLSKEVKPILKIKLLFVQVVIQHIRLKMVLMKEN